MGPEVQYSTSNVKVILGPTVCPDSGLKSQVIISWRCGEKLILRAAGRTFGAKNLRACHLEAWVEVDLETSAHGNSDAGHFLGVDSFFAAHLRNPSPPMSSINQSMSWGCCNIHQKDNFGSKGGRSMSSELEHVTPPKTLQDV